MKNMYVGDVGDYGKYGLLRFLSMQGIMIGVNWYLTKNDNSNDGKHITYFDREKERIYDPFVYDALKDIVQRQDRNVYRVEDAGIIPHAIFYHEILDTTAYAWQRRQEIRDEWHRRALETLQGAQLVFADPDNGTIGTNSLTSKNAEKYTTLEELADYYNRGQDVVYYCHKARRTDAQWQDKMLELQSVLVNVKIMVLTFRRGTQRSYIFGIHPERYPEYNQRIESFLETEWGTFGARKAFMREL